MAHHKRGRPKQQRAGCLFCKPHKANCSKDSAESMLARDRRRVESGRDEHPGDCWCSTCADAMHPAHPDGLERICCYEAGFEYAQ